MYGECHYCGVTLTEENTYASGVEGICKDCEKENRD